MPLPVPAWSGGTLATASRPRVAVTAPVPTPGHDQTGHQPPGRRAGAEAGQHDDPGAHHDQTHGDPGRPAPPLRQHPDAEGRDRTRPRPGQQQHRREQHPAAVPALQQRRRVRGDRDDPGPGDERADRGRGQPGPPERAQIDHRRPGPQLVQHERGQQPDRAGQQGQHRRPAPAQPALGERGQQAAEPARQQQRADRVDPAAAAEGRLRQQRRGGQGQRGGQPGQHHVRDPPAAGRLDQRHQHPDRARPRRRSSRPTRRSPRPAP